MCRISTGILYPIRSSNTCQFNTSVSFKFGRYISPHFIILVTYVLQAVQVVLPSCSVDTWCNYRTRTSKAIKKNSLHDGAFHEIQNGVAVSLSKQLTCWQGCVNDQQQPKKVPGHPVHRRQHLDANKQDRAEVLPQIVVP